MKKLNLVPLKNTSVDDFFFNKYTKLVPNKMLPYQYKALNDDLPNTEPSHSIFNFKIAAGLDKGEFKGFVFQDSDLAKWIEAVAFSLASTPDEKLEAQADEIIDLIEKAQCDDGYINTYFTLKVPDKRWCNLRDCHELYVAGHFMEAAVAYYNITGKRKLLDIMCRFADLICEVFNKKEFNAAVPGHQEIEIGLLKMYQVTKTKAYLDMASCFIERRGHTPNYIEVEHKLKTWYKFYGGDDNNYDPTYSQCHLPVREQKTAEGHSVRAMYMYCAMADLAYEKNDETLLKACKELWENITQKRMYITGGVGSSAGGERFTSDYDLPNRGNYSESCASIGLALFGRRMTQITGDGKYFNEAEASLYNTVLSGVSLDGTKFFYVNPMELDPKYCMEHTSMSHVKSQRQGWYGCACCPPNIARTLASLGEYVYFCNEEKIWVNMFVSGKTQINNNYRTINLVQEGNYPFDNKVKITVTSSDNKSIDLAVRIPVKDYTVYINSQETDIKPVNSYLNLSKIDSGSEIVIEFDLSANFVYSSGNLRETVNKVAIKKGPVVYCAEGIDNNESLSSVLVDTSKPIVESFDENLFGGTTVLEVSAKRQINNEILYTEEKPKFEETKLKLIPYCYFANREESEMAVWFNKVSS